MEKLCEELDEAKLEVEKLKKDCRVKVEQHGNLKKAYDEQNKKLKETSLKVENQGHQLAERDEEIFMLKQMYEEAKGRLDERVQIVKRLSAANEKLRYDLDTKLQKHEEDNRSLVLTLEEATLKCAEQERKIKQLEEENWRIKGLVEKSVKKCSEAEEEARSPKRMKQRENVIVDLEEECRKVQDQLKWKKEQFKHLEEAHSKLRDQFRAEKKEWEKEKSNFLHEIGSLQEKLDSQIRISEDLEKRLQMCNQSLAYEQGRRKNLEVQLLDFKMRFETVSVECEEAKSHLEGLMLEKDREIGNLRHSLGKKEALYKEIEYRSKQLERENQELLVSLKELQEAQIHESSGHSLAKLKSKLKNVEKTHRECLSNLRAKEAEWRSKLKELSIDLDKSRSEITDKEITLQEAEKELKYSNSSLMELMLQNDVILLVLKAGISESQLKLAKEWVDDGLLEQQERKEEDALEIQQLQITTNENLGDIIEENDKLKLELQRNKKILEEAMDSDEKIKEVCHALDRTNSELAEKICEANETEFELQIWKSTAEQLRFEIEENRYQRKELEASLLAQVEVEDALKQEKRNLILMLEDRDGRINCLQQKIVQIEQNLQTRAESEKKDVIFKDLVDEIQGLEQEVFRREFESTLEAVIVMEKAYQIEKEELLQLLEAKNERINNLLQKLSSLEQKFETSSASFSSNLEEKQGELSFFHEALEKITSAEILAEVEIEEKRMMVMELEDEIANLTEKLESQGECLWRSKQRVMEVEGELKAKDQLSYHMQMKLQSSEAMIEELKSEKDKLIKERDDLLRLMVSVEDKLGEYCSEDEVLMGRILHLPSFNRSCSSDEFAGNSKENSNSQGMVSVKLYEANSNGRSPFRELNN